MSAYRQSPFANLTPVVKNLLIINIIFAVASFILRSKIDIAGILGAYYFNSADFRLWQIISYMFVHAPLEVQPAHILFNMLALYMFGPILEYSMGPKQFLKLYFICGIGAAVFQMIVQAIQVHGLTGGIMISHPELLSSFAEYGANGQALYGIYHTPIVGASGAIFGLLVAFGMMYPNMEMFLFFVPIPIKAKYLIPLYVVLEIYLGVKQSGGDNVAHFAHIGGALLGFIMVKIWRLQGTNNFR